MTRREPAHPRAPRRGRQPTRRHGTPHVPVDDGDGCCAICRRPADAPNDRHLKTLPATNPDVLAEEQRRLGETDE